MEAAEGRRAFLISRTWIQVVLLVVLCGFFVLGSSPTAPTPLPSMIGVLMVALAGLVLVAKWARHHSAAETGLLLGLLAVVALVASRLLRDLRVHPANFPTPTPSFGLKLPGGE